MSTELEVTDVHHHGHGHEQHEIIVSVIRLDPPSHKAHVESTSHSPLLQVLRRGAEHLHIELLPPDSDQPLDRLHNIHDHAAVGPPITDLEQDLGHFVSHGDNTPDFGIELVRAFRVNTRWAVAPESDMSPRDILALPAIGLDHTQYTLYAIGSSDPLPLDTAVPITRGQAFEAQRDGKYGAA